MLDLLAIGFRPAGRWRLVEERPDLVLNDCGALSPVLYAFVIEERVMYVGKTAQSLRRRLYGYKRPGPRQITNIRNNQRIMDALHEGLQVEILVYHDPDPVQHGAFIVNTAAGLEDDIIRTLRPPWNGRERGDNGERATKSRIDTAHPSTDGTSVEHVTQETTKRSGAPTPREMQSSESSDQNTSGRFTFILGATYHRTGFFNVPRRGRTSLWPPWRDPHHLSWRYRPHRGPFGAEMRELRTLPSS